MQYLVENWGTSEDNIGKTLRIAMAWTQYRSGVPYPILMKTTQDLLYVKSRTILATEISK